MALVKCKFTLLCCWFRPSSGGLMTKNVSANNKPQENKLYELFCAQSNRNLTDDASLNWWDNKTKYIEIWPWLVIWRCCFMEKLILIHLVSVHAFCFIHSISYCMTIFITCTHDITFLQVSFPAFYSGAWPPTLPIVSNMHILNIFTVHEITACHRSLSGTISCLT